MSVDLRELVRLFEETNAPIVLTLSPAQVSAVEIYIVDDAHEEEPWYDKVVLRGNKLILNMTYDQASEMFADANNSADSGDGKKPDRGAVTALNTLRDKLRVATGQAPTKPQKVKTSKLKTLRNWIYQAINKPRNF